MQRSSQANSVVRCSSVPLLVAALVVAGWAHPAMAQRARSLAARDRAFANAEVLQKRDSAPDAEGRFDRVKIVRSHPQAPPIRIEEKVVRDAVSGKETVVHSTEVAAHRLIVKLRDGQTRADLNALNRRVGAKVRFRLRSSDAYVIELSDHGVDALPNAIAAYADSGVAGTIYRDCLMYVLQGPCDEFAGACEPPLYPTGDLPPLVPVQNDPNQEEFDGPDDQYFGMQWALRNVGQDIDITELEGVEPYGKPGADIGAVEAWKHHQGSRDVVVAVIDSGVDYTHPDLENNIWINDAEVKGGLRSWLLSLDSGLSDPERAAELAALISTVIDEVDSDGNGRIDAWEILVFLRAHELDYNGDSKYNLADLVADGSPFRNNSDEDGNGHKDDILGWSYFGGTDGTGTPDPWPADFDDHGTLIAGVIGAEGNNGIGIAGVCWNVRILPLRAYLGGILSSDAKKAIEYASDVNASTDDRVVAVNASWFVYDCYEQSSCSSMSDAIAYAETRDVIVVMAAGNYKVDNDDSSTTYYPQVLNGPTDNVISVAATNSDDEFYWANNVGSHYGANTVDLAAPGTAIYSTTLIYPNYPHYSNTPFGTSLSAPHVAGACALLKSAMPDLTHCEIIDRVLGATDCYFPPDFPSGCPSDVCDPETVGATVTNGRLNIGRMMADTCFSDDVQPQAAFSVNTVCGHGGAPDTTYTIVSTAPDVIQCELSFEYSPPEVAAWLTVAIDGSPWGGGAIDVAPHLPVEVTIGIDATVASNLQTGQYECVVDFVNPALRGDGCARTSRSIQLAVGEGIEVSPADEFVTSGTVGRPFGGSMKYIISNPATTGSGVAYAIDWGPAGKPSWLTIAGATTGTLAPEQETEVTLAIDPTEAALLDVGEYNCTVSFANMTNVGFGDASREVTLHVTPPPVAITMAVSPSGAGTTVPVAGATYLFPPGHVLDITATAAGPNTTFAGWVVDAGIPPVPASSATATINCDVDKTITAQFETCEWSIQEPLTLVATGDPGGPFTPDSFLFAVENSGTVSINDYTVQARDHSTGGACGWITLSGNTGTISPQAMVNTTATIDASTLPPGVYTCTLEFRGTETNGIALASDKVIELRIGFQCNFGIEAADGHNWTASGPVCGSFNPDTLWFYEWGDPAGGGYIVTPDCDWIDPTTGTLPPGKDQWINNVSINANANMLAAGCHTCTLTFDGWCLDGYTIPIERIVLLGVGTECNWDVAAEGATLPNGEVGTVGEVGGSFEVTQFDYVISNSSGGDISYAVTADRDWVTVPNNGVMLGADSPLTVTVSLNALVSTLEAGSDTCTLRFYGDCVDGFLRVIEKTITVQVFPGCGWLVEALSPLSARGLAGGTASPSEFSFHVWHRSEGPVSYIVDCDCDWITPPGPGMTALLYDPSAVPVVASINANAQTLQVGTHACTLTFSGDCVSGGGSAAIQETITLRVTCNEPPQDVDGDGDVDLADFGVFSGCFRGLDQPYPVDDPRCACFDSDGDSDVDLTDFNIFSQCFNGPDRPPRCLPVPTYSLQVTVDGEGSVSLNPGGGVYEEGTTVTLTAETNEGWVVIGWSGGLTGNENPATVDMDADKAVTAHFVQIHTLAVTVVGQGSVSLSPVGGVYEAGSTVTVTAEPTEGWVFIGWSGDLAGNENPATVDMDADKAVTAHFGEPPLETVLIPAGEFQMGDSFEEGGASEQPVHTVSVDAFFIDRHEVTEGLWDTVRAWAMSQGYSDLAVGAGKDEDHPVLRVNWHDCVKWCNARSEMEERTPCYYTDAAFLNIYRFETMAPYVKWEADGYRLPTEAEWEKAARGGAAGHRFPWSDSDVISHARANYYSSISYAYDNSETRNHHPTFYTGNWPFTSPVDYFAPNDFGLYGMAGNVWEWCNDWYGSTYYNSSPYTNPRGPATGYSRLIRGGSWDSYANGCRAAHRGSRSSASLDGHCGFRCVVGTGGAD